VVRHPRTRRSFKSTRSGRIMAPGGLLPSSPRSTRQVANVIFLCLFQPAIKFASCSRVSLRLHQRWTGNFEWELLQSLPNVCIYLDLSCADANVPQVNTADQVQKLGNLLNRHRLLLGPCSVFLFVPSHVGEQCCHLLMVLLCLCFRYRRRCFCCHCSSCNAHRFVVTSLH
jgi:hypothetical protein